MIKTDKKPTNPEYLNRNAHTDTTPHRTVTCEKCGAVNVIILTNLAYGAVSEPEVYSKAAQYQKDQIVVVNQVPHLVLGGVFSFHRSLLLGIPTAKIQVLGISSDT